MPVAWCTSAPLGPRPLPGLLHAGAVGEQGCRDDPADDERGVQVDVAADATLVEREHADGAVLTLTHRQGVHHQRREGGQGVRLEQRPPRVGSVDVEEVESCVGAGGERIGARALADDVLRLLQVPGRGVGDGQRHPCHEGVRHRDRATVAPEQVHCGAAQPVGQGEARRSALGQPPGQPREEVVDISHGRPLPLRAAVMPLVHRTLRRERRRLSRPAWPPSRA